MQTFFAKRPLVFAVAFALTCVFALTSLVGCGGGGGDDEPGLPGTFAVVALEGDPLPGPTVGAFGAIPSGGGGGEPRMALAANGWSAFIAPTTNGGIPQVACVMDDAANLVEVLASAQPLPAPSDGTVASMERIWMAQNGTVVVYVTVAGDTGGRTFALLSVVVDGGVAGPLQRVAYHLDALAGAGGAGMLTAIDLDRTRIADDGRMFFVLTQSMGGDMLASAPADGSTLAGHVRPGDAVAGGAVVAVVEEFGIAPAGARFAFVASTSAADRRLYLGAPGVATYDEVARDGDSLGMGAGTIDNVWTGGPLIAYSGGTVVWRARGSVAANDDVILVGSDVAIQPLARRGGAALNTGAGTYGALRLIDQEGQISFPYFSAEVVGAGNGITFAIFGVTDVSMPAAPAIFNGRAVSQPAGERLGTTYPSLDRPPLVAAARNSTLGFAAIVSNGDSGVYWLLPNEDFVAVAVEGQTATPGEVWGTFAPSAFVTLANDGIQWVGELANAGLTGIFRRVR